MYFTTTTIFLPLVCKLTFEKHSVSRHTVRRNYFGSKFKIRKSLMRWCRHCIAYKEEGLYIATIAQVCKYFAIVVASWVALQPLKSSLYTTFSLISSWLTLIVYSL